LKDTNNYLSSILRRCSWYCTRTISQLYFLGSYFSTSGCSEEFLDVCRSRNDNSC